MTDRDALLWGIADHPEDDGRRLVFSDWLEENGDPDRADFLRIQCALADTQSPADRGPDLRLRERELLDAHRRGWIAATGLPLADVTFRRGLIAAARLSTWDGGALDPATAPWLAAVEELDLSGLGLGDDGLTAFARTARLPALRKLILSGNGITDAGVLALAAATGLPRLDTAYLFDNPVGETALVALKQSPAFRLKTLDVGDAADGYLLSPGEAEVARRRFVREQLLPVVSRYFAAHEHLRSAALCVAQYWADEADDAVHDALVVSELPEPVLAGVAEWDDDGPPDPNIPNTPLVPEYGTAPSSVVSLYGKGVQWDSNNSAIPLWAAFAPEGGSQETHFLDESYAPAVLFFRHGGYEFRPMLRPHLDGVRPEWA